MNANIQKRPRLERGRGQSGRDLRNNRDGLREGTPPITPPLYSISPFHESGESGTNWVIDGVLPRVGIALVESATPAAAELVAESMAFAVGYSEQWGGRNVLAGNAIRCTSQIDAASYPERDEPRVTGEPDPFAGLIPPMNLDAFGGPFSFMKAAELRGGARIVVVHLAPDYPAVSERMLANLRDLAETLQACILVATASDLPGIDTLRAAAATVLHVTETPDGIDDSTGLLADGCIRMAKGGGARFAFLLDDYAATIDDVWELARAN